MKKAMYMVMVLLLMAGIVSACGNSYEPHAINEETDRCVVCNMAVKDDQFATQIITKEGQPLMFDDIGCMNQWKADNGTETIGAQYVRDYHSKQWIEFDNASYVYDASFQTPMAYGLLSFENQDEAQAFINESGKGKLMSAEELQNHTWQRNREMMGGKHDHSHDASGTMEMED